VRCGGGEEAEWWSVRCGAVDAAVFIAGETGNLKPNFLSLLFETYFENKVT
jgi:hypothetical protein